MRYRNRVSQPGARKNRRSPKRTPDTRTHHESPPAVSTGRGTLFAALAVGLAIRASAVALGRADPFFQPVLLDSKYYHDWAVRIVAGDLAGPGVFYGLPLYPYFLALCYALFGPSVVAVKLIQVALGLVTVILVYAIGVALADRTVGLVAAGFAAVYGPLFFHETMLVPEAVGVPLYAAAFLGCCRFLEAPSVRRGIASGVLLGLACLTKAGVMPFVLLFVAALALRPRLAASPPAAGALAAIALSFAAILAPVTLHNRLHGGDWVLLTSHAGLNFYIGNNPDADGVFRAPAGTGIGLEAQIADSRALAEDAAGRPLKPSEVSAYWAGKARNFIAEHPGRFLMLAVRKLGLAFDARELSDLADYADAGRFNPLLRLPWPTFAVLGPLVLAGLVLAPAPRRRWLVVLWIGTYLAGLLTFFVNARYRLPLLPVAFVLAALALRDLALQARIRAWRPLAVNAVLLVVAAGLTRLQLVAVDPARDDVNAASLRLKAKDHAGALALYEQALELNPDNAQANLGMGIALAAVGRGDEAGAFYARSIAISPDPAAYTNLGAWHQQRGDVAAAEDAYRRALAANPRFAQAHNNLGILLARRGETANAIASFATAIRLDPRNCKAEVNMARALTAAGRSDEAAPHEARARAIDPACVP